MCDEKVSKSSALSSSSAPLPQAAGLRCCLTFLCLFLCLGTRNNLSTHPVEVARLKRDNVHKEQSTVPGMQEVPNK